MGNEINAVMLQAVLSGLLGTGFAASSVIWEIDTWSMVKQTGIYFSIISAVMLLNAAFTQEQLAQGLMVRKGKKVYHKVSLA